MPRHQTGLGLRCLLALCSLREAAVSEMKWETSLVCFAYETNRKRPQTIQENDKCQTELTYREKEVKVEERKNYVGSGKPPASLYLKAESSPQFKNCMYPHHSQKSKGSQVCFFSERSSPMYALS